MSDNWQYNFKVMFNGNSAESNQYMVLPLATIAADVQVKNQTLCKLFVQELNSTDNNYDYDFSIIMGSMFFSQIGLSAYQGVGNMDGEYASYMLLYLNENKLNNTNITNATMA